MKKRICLFMCSVLLSGCASVKFYSSKDNYKEKTGIKYYEAKPYMLVTHKAKDQLDIQMIYLPDKSKAYIAKFSPGLGSHEFTVGLSNGILTSYGQKSDPKVAELIQSMTGLLKEGVATASSAGVFGVQGAHNYTLLAKEVESITNNLNTGVKEIPTLTDAEKSTDKINAVSENLKSASQILNQPTPNVDDVLLVLKNSREDLSMFKKTVSDAVKPESPTARYNAVLLTALTRIDGVIKTIKGEPAPELPFELYEIKISDVDGTTSLEKVK